MALRGVMPRRLLVLLLALTSSACLEKCAPGRVGSGVARLTVRNVGTILDLINSDDRCGFESAGVKAGFTASGEPGKLGSVTWTVQACEIDLSAAPKVVSDCNDSATSIRGRIVVSARRTVAGKLTGDLEEPVIPLSPDAVTLELTDVELFDFTVADASGENELSQRTGHLSAVARPRLAADADGICQIATPNVEISRIRYTDATAHVHADGHSFDVVIPRSDLTAVNGVHGDQENRIFGSVAIWGKTKTFRNEGEELDPEYDRETFLSSFACTDGLAAPLSFECGDVGALLAQGAARLTIRSLGAITDLIEHDTTCGFSSDAVLSSVELSAAAGELGEARFRVERCSIELPEGTVLKESCRGEPTVISGRVTVTGEKIMNGRLTGDLIQPVVPMNDHPAHFDLSRIEFSSFTVEEDGTSLRQISGALTAQVDPRTALDTTLDACGFETPIARMRGVAYLEPTQVMIHAEQGSFSATVDAAMLDAVNGTWDGESNALSGSITLEGDSYRLPVDPADPGLDPDFDQTAFDEGWACGTVDRDHPFECRFGAPLAQGAAQLTAIALGTLARALDDDQSCGFSSAPVLAGAAIQGALGEPGGSATFTIEQPCVLSYPEPTVLEEDCNGKKTLAQGTARVSGTKTLRGYVSGDPLEPIVPTSRDPAELALAIDFDELSIWTDPGENQLRAHGGRLTGTLRPRTAIDSETGACSIPTPVAVLDGMTWTGGDLTIVSENRAFHIAVADSKLIAVNGERDGAENTLEGTLTLDGDRYAIPVEGGLGLDPDYDPQRFTDSFACTPNLVIPASEADCNLNEPLGGGVARLLISALGSVAGLANGDQFGCAFGATGTLTDPIRVDGDVGQQGEMEWRIEGCRLTYDPGARPYETDCLGTRSYLYGLASVTGNRVVSGIRNQIDILFFSIDSIIPNDPRSVTVTFDDIRFEDFESFDLDQDRSVPDRRIPHRGGRHERGGGAGHRRERRPRRRHPRAAGGCVRRADEGRPHARRPRRRCRRDDPLRREDVQRARRSGQPVCVQRIVEPRGRDQRDLRRDLRERAARYSGAAGPRPRLRPGRLRQPVRMHAQSGGDAAAVSRVRRPRTR